MDMDTGIDTLLKAADYLAWKDRAEAEHGYASSPPLVQEETYVRRRPNHKHRKSQGNRSSHNELEKNRRAHLRHCLEKLKDMVPLGPDSSRHTTLGLLTKAKAFIKALEDKERKQEHDKDRLAREQRHLRQRLDQLTNGYRIRIERSISESSSSQLSTSSTSSYESYESDEVDILGYGSSEDDLSVHSSISPPPLDGRLTLTDAL